MGRSDVTTKLDEGAGLKQLVSGHLTHSNAQRHGSRDDESHGGQDGSNLITGGDGDDRLRGTTGDDDLRGGDGDDRLEGGAGGDRLDGGAGNDCAIYRASPGGVHVDLSSGKAEWNDADGDQLDEIENIAGSRKSDWLVGDGRDNLLDGHSGKDTLDGEAGNDRLWGGRGDDFIIGDSGNDRILGGGGDDLIDAGTGQDIVMGGGGNDTIYGGPDPDVILYAFAWEDMNVRYEGSDFSIWAETPDGDRDHIFSALTIATTTGTWRFDVPTQSWVHASDMTTSDWLAI
jgi:Ca2+-binding RTX toxin-like protein